MRHQRDLDDGYGDVYLPAALENQYPDANRKWEWQYVFPARNLSTDPRTGKRRRHHLGESGPQKAVRKAVQLANIQKSVSCLTFRHSFAALLLESGYDIRTVQDLLGHKDVKTTLVYTRVLDRGNLAVRSPLD
jgi:integrase